MKKFISVIISLVMMVSVVFCMTPQTANAETLNETVISDRLLTKSEVSKYIDYNSAVENGHVERMYAEEDELNMIVYRNMDGTRTAYFFPNNVKYMENGIQKDKDIGLKANLNGYTTNSNDVMLNIPTNINNGIEFAYGNDIIKLTPVVQNANSNVSTYALANEREKFASADLEKNAVTYNSVFGTATSLRYTPLLNGIKEDIVLASYTGVNSWSFIAQTNGLKVFQSAGGAYYFADAADSKVRYSLGNVYVKDSAENSTYGTMNVTTLTEGERYKITLTVDTAFLTDEDTVYPVYVDPQVIVEDNYIKDATICNGLPNGNYGENNVLYMGQRDIYGLSRAVVSLGYDYSRLGTIIDANLRFNVIEYPEDGATLSFHQFNQGWSESSVTWGNINPQNFNSSEFAEVDITESNWYEVDFTDIINIWRGNSIYMSYGMLIKLDDEDLDQDTPYVSFGSSDHPNFPMTLIVRYELNLNYYFHTGASLEKDETFNLRKNTLMRGVISYASSDTSVATVSSTGVVTAKGNGLAEITITIKSDGNNDGDYTDSVDSIINFISNIVVGDAYPSMFISLWTNGILGFDEYERTGTIGSSTDDTFFMMTVPVSTILSRMGITTITGYTDWYFYGICNGETTDVISMTKFVTGGVDANNNPLSAVRVSFLSFDFDLLLDLIDNESLDTEALQQGLSRVVSPNTQIFGGDNANTKIINYFSSAETNGSYLIAEIYVKKVVEERMNKTTHNITLVQKANDNVKEFEYSILNNTIRTPLLDAANAYNSAANVTKYNLDEGTISISNPNSITYEELSQILVSHTGNTSIFAFAAEIQYHAETNLDISPVENSTIIADMTIGNYDAVLGDIPNLIVQFGIVNMRIDEQVMRHECSRYVDILNEYQGENP